MGILDEAIREHLELKRQHGADDSELKQLEDEAFGPPERPGSAEAGAESPTELMTAPEIAEEAGASEEGAQRREPRAIADLQEAPPPPEEAPPPEPVEEEPAAEHEAIAEPEAEAGPVPSPEGHERQSIAEQPTEHFDIEEELGASAAEPGPTDEELVEEEMDEPRLAPLDPLAEVEEIGEVEVEAAPEAAAPEAPETAAPAAPEPEEDEDDEFWSDQRLSEELDNALDAPLDEGGPQTAEARGTDAEEETFRGPAPDSDVLEDTPDFLEDAPEDDELWFEQKPPKDFDFDD